MQKLLRSLILSAANQLQARYRVSIVWEGQRITHWAKSEHEAREWLACYVSDVKARIEHYPFFCGFSPILIAGRNV